MDPISGFGIIVSLLAWLRSEGGSRKSTEELLATLEKAEDIQRYLEWVRRRDHNELVAELNSAKGDLLHEFKGIVGHLGSVREQVIEASGDLADRIADLSAAIPPPVLSPIPIETRQPVDIPIIGREDEISALSAAEGDCLLVGQPGSGKTAILKEIANQFDARFLVTRDPETSVGAVTSAGVAIILIDDAYQSRETIRRLRHARTEFNLNFRVIAACWPFEEEDLVRDLGLPAEAAISLEGLPRVQIGEIVKAICSKRSRTPMDHFIANVVDQARGNPGLAASLTEATLSGQGSALFSGELLVKNLLPALSSGTSKDCRWMLACFSLAGKEGTSVKLVAEALDESLPNIAAATNQVALAGVLEAREKGVLAVVPEHLRSGLIKTAFYPGGGGGLTEVVAFDLIDRLKRPELGYEELALARFRTEAQVDIEHLKSAAMKLNSPRLWTLLAWLDKETCEWVLNELSPLPEEIHMAALHFIPSIVIPRLLDQYAEADRNPNSLAGHDRSTVKKWISEGWNDAFERRQILCASTLEWLESGGGMEIAIEALNSVFSLAFESTGRDPADHMKYHFKRGVIPLALAKRAYGLWQNIQDTIENGLIAPHMATKLIGAWLSPGGFARDNMDEAYQEFLVQSATQMIESLIPHAERRPALGRWILIKGGRLKMTLPPDLVSADFMTLFPPRTRGEDWKAEEELRAKAARDMAANWAKKPLADSFEMLVTAIEEIELLSANSWPRLERPFLEALLRLRAPTEDEIWLGIRQLPPNLADLVIQAAIANGILTEEHIGEIRVRPELNPVLVELSLTESIPLAPAEIEDIISGYQALVDVLVLRKLVSEKIVAWLLKHPFKAIRDTTALGLFRSSDRGVISDGLIDSWRDCMVACLTLDRESRYGDPPYDQVEILRSFPEIGVLVIERLLESEDILFLECNKSLLAHLIPTLSSDDRLALLQKCRLAYTSSLAVLLVGKDLEIYGALLSDPELKSFHLDPLSGNPNDAGWKDLAKLALQYGIDAELVSHAIDYGGYSWEGPLSKRYEALMNQFGQLALEEDPEIQEIARHGIKWTTKARDRERHEEKRRDVYGSE